MKPDNKTFGQKNKDGQIIHKPTHSIVSGLQLPSSGYTTEPVGNGYFVRYTASDHARITETMRQDWQQGKTKSAKKHASEGEQSS